MDTVLKTFDLNTMQWTAVISAALLVGFSKTGIGGVTMLAIPILASVFGGKDSTGIMLPMLLVGDIFAVWHYHRSAKWKDIRMLLPWTVVGLVSGAIVGNFISDYQFKLLIGVFVTLCLGILIYIEKSGQNFKVPSKAWFYILAGVLCGFASMIGNAAGPIFGIYLLAMGFKKNNYMGTNAWFFLIINFDSTLNVVEDSKTIQST